MKGIVDRIEGELVVVELEDGKMKDYPKSLFPRKIKSGDAIIQDGETFIIDQEKTKALKKEIDELINDLFVD